mmetsp:Transcript_4335/g.6233  ORF Transcript_4335/g.6233 Transcript_4335/m.6233 type:complete len:789 (+) Transcript_4335:134-2500(+)|eukprot:CAMPEP_0194213886 /NCGR_PEP_ID=MMETSP0156-20130528/14762_1 /TAXON_ID=33649 /ORGANISM="Thalassionema nitzschioides, Strain L26-B" /LENGTH=788 /DNA_ID=CAMNT_0038942021 /DNA_START=100 /DNA_END=2466 /DNA_ORIENTATION=+
MLKTATSKRSITATASIARRYSGRALVGAGSDGDGGSRDSPRRPFSPSQKGTARSGPQAGKVHRGGPRKDNFSKTYLEPAQQGKLKGHHSGIPRLAARKKKSTRMHDNYPGKEADEALDQAFLGASTQDLEESVIRSSGSFNEDNKKLFSLSNTGPHCVDDEDDHDDFDLGGFDPENHPDIYKDEEGNMVFMYDPENPFVTSDDSGGRGKGGPPEDKGGDLTKFSRGRFEDERLGNPEEMFFNRNLLDPNFPNLRDHIKREDANKLLPLDVQGVGLDDFIEATYEHPSKYAIVERDNPHQESLREPKALFPKNRQQPSEEFVNAHLRFLFVSGLPHFADNGQLGDIANPLHRVEVLKMVSDILGVKTESVSPASMTSAFVGYKDKNDLYEFFKFGPKYRTVDSEIKLSRYNADEVVQAGFAEYDVIIKLDGIPAAISTPRLVHAIFPKGSEAGRIYGPLESDDIKRLTPTVVLIRLKSEDQGESILTCSLMKEHMSELGRSNIRFFRARRELIHGGYTGPAHGQIYQKRGKKLVVDGDKPSNELFQSHSGVIQLTNLHSSFTKADLTDFFQSFSADRRDVFGSIEFATCSHGERTHVAYVGFDRFGEAEAVLKSCSGLLDLGKGPVTVRLVKQLGNPKAGLNDERPNRSEEELLDSLNNWEQYVDSKDIEELGKKGIPKETFSDFFRVLRFKNRSYGAYDWGIKEEKTTAEQISPGHQIRETMRHYVDTLKEVHEMEGEDYVPLETALTLPADEETGEGEHMIHEDVLVEKQKQHEVILKKRRDYFSY